MKLIERTIADFAAELAGDSPAPGGGSTAALAGVLAASLSAMVARLTLAKDKYREHWAEMEGVRTEADALARRLLELVDEDSAAYDGVSAAFRLPRETDEQKALRRQTIQVATLKAAAVPLETLETVASLLKPVRTVLERGNPNCLTDAGVAVEMIRAAAFGAAFNVRINLGGLEDSPEAARISGMTGELLERIKAETGELEKMVEERLA